MKGIDAAAWCSAIERLGRGEAALGQNEGGEVGRYSRCLFIGRRRRGEAGRGGEWPATVGFKDIQWFRFQGGRRRGGRCLE
jgi:hypothetical protein